MSETKHTPAPWSVDPYDRFDKCALVGTSDGWLAEVKLENLPDGQGEANVRLIAACPVMYGYISRKAEEGDEDAARIIAAINAAEGSQP